MSNDQENPIEGQEENPVNQPDFNQQQSSNNPVQPPPFQNAPPFNQFGGNYGGQQNLPNATAALVLGILSIPACCFYGFFGIIFGVIAVILATGDIKKYNLSPGLFTEASFKNTKAGKICGIVGLSLSVLHIIFWILFFVGIVSNADIFRQILESLKN